MIIYNDEVDWKSFKKTFPEVYQWANEMPTDVRRYEEKSEPDELDKHIAKRIKEYTGKVKVYKY